MTKIILRTHGGLGNQLFQIFYGLCCKHEFGIQRLASVHDDRYRHRFQFEERLRGLVDEASVFEAFLSSLRMPKLLSKITRKNIEILNIRTTCILDGYFQKSRSYHQFSVKSMQMALSDLKSALELCDPVAEQIKLEHIRLGDFFTDPVKEAAAAQQIINKISYDCHIVTNNESLVRSICSGASANPKKTVVKTEGMGPVDLLHLMGRYYFINSNDSTLALWAAILYGRQLNLKSPDLNEFYSTFSKNIQ